MKLKSMLLLVGLLVLLTACSDTAGPATPVPPVDLGSVPSTPEYGGEMVQATIGEPSNLIALLATDSSSHEVAALLYVSLLKYDKNIELVPDAAESFEVLNDGKLLRFKLREDIRWTDGVPMTAEDVEFTFKLYIDPETPTAYAENYKAVTAFRRTGKYTFEVEYDQPFAKALVSWAFDILPKHLLEGEDLLKTKYSRQPVGAGPYVLKEWVPGERLVLEANDDYFDGRPYFDRIIYRIIPDLSTQFLELKAGNLGMMDLTALQYLFQTSGPGWDGSFNKFEYLSFGYTYLAYNFEHPFFQDKRVRQALDYAIDKDQIVGGVYFGKGVPAVGPYKPGTWQYNTNIRPRPHDPEKARQLLAEAGWRDTDGDGLLDKDGKPFAFAILTNQGNTQRIKAGIIIQQSLKDVGIKVTVRAIEWAAFIKEFVDKARFDALILGWNILQDPDIYNVWHSSQAKERGLNFIRYKNPELDDLLERGRRMLDPEKRKPIYDRVQQILHEEQPYCFLAIPMSLPIIQARVQGIEPAPAGISHNFIRWWIPKTLQRQQ